MRTPNYPIQPKEKKIQFIVGHEHKSKFHIELKDQKELINGYKPIDSKASYNNDILIYLFTWYIFTSCKSCLSKAFNNVYTT